MIASLFSFVQIVQVVQTVQVVKAVQRSRFNEVAGSMFKDSAHPVTDCMVVVGGKSKGLIGGESSLP